MTFSAAAGALGPDGAAGQEHRPAGQAEQGGLPDADDDVVPADRIARRGSSRR